jgi:hemerythrin superfamily protein
MDAITLLTQDHQAVRELLDQLAESTTRATKKRTDLLSKIAIQLKAHTTIEEEIFYPAFKSAGDKSDDAMMYFEALEEHRAAGDLVLPDLLDTPTDSEKFSGRAKVLKELVTHHADEEEKGMFKRAKQLMDAAELKELGEKLKARKTELMEQFKAETETRAQAS